jgi:hypothetical protein
LPVPSQLYKCGGAGDGVGFGVMGGVGLLLVHTDWQSGRDKPDDAELHLPVPSQLYKCGGAGGGVGVGGGVGWVQSFEHVEDELKWPPLPATSSHLNVAGGRKLQL